MLHAEFGPQVACRGRIGFKLQHKSYEALAVNLPQPVVGVRVTVYQVQHSPIFNADELCIAYWMLLTTQDHDSLSRHS